MSAWQRCQEIQDSREGNSDPRRSIDELVADLVEVALQEGGAHGEVPETCPRLQSGEVFRTHSRRLAEQGRVGGVMEGSQHPGDVPEGRALEPSDTKGARRLAFEVDNHEVVARIEHLPEVVVTVATDVDRFDLPVARQPEPVANLLLELQDPLRLLSDLP